MFSVRIESISIQNFRSIDFAKISFDSNITIICGENNAGKTTLLEAIYLSSNLKSFKAVSNVELIRSSSNFFKLSLNFFNKTSNNSIFVEKSLKSSKILYNNKKITKTDASTVFPCYSLVFGFNNVLLNDSSYRRDFIDTGMFHVEPESRKSFNVFEKSLKQRNFLLKSKNYESIGSWERQLVDANNTLSEYRESYFKNLRKHFYTIIENIKDIESIESFGEKVGQYNIQNKIIVTLNNSKNINISKIKRDFLSNSSCGVCGKSSLDALEITNRHF